MRLFEDTERRHSNMLLDMYFIFLFLQLCINQTFALRNYTNSQRWHEGYRKHIFQKYIFASISRQIDNKSRVLKEEKGVWSSQSGEKGLEFSRRRKGQTFFIYILSVQSVQFSRSVVSDSLGLVLVNYTTQFNSVLGIIQQQCILLEDSFSFLKTFWVILLF